MDSTAVIVIIFLSFLSLILFFIGFYFSLKIKSYIQIIDEYRCNNLKISSEIKDICSFNKYALDSWESSAKENVELKTKYNGLLLFSKDLEKKLKEVSNG